MSDQAKFAIYYHDSSYSTSQKIMGRQSAGKAFMRGVARAWNGTSVHGVGSGEQVGRKMFEHLQSDGFRGTLRWTEIPAWQDLRDVGCLYYPSPTAKEIAHSRNMRDATDFSLMGVTFTLSSSGAMTQVAELVLPPFKPWDAMICISHAARKFSLDIQEDYKQWFASQTGAVRFNSPQMPVIPLGIDCPTFVSKPGEKESARAILEIAPDKTVFLFAGRLSFHAKANPAAVYQALERVAKQTPIVCIEAGVFPNDSIRKGFLAAQALLAPSVKFIWVDGKDEVRYQHAWKAADVFVSLSDNIQETFGLTPVEAMAAGLPVVVSDWNGYKDTIRDGIDGYRIPTILPPPSVGRDLAERHGLNIDSYDLFIGRVSLATVVEPESLYKAFFALATQGGLREQMGASGRQRANEIYDWPVVLQQYSDLAIELNQIRLSSKGQHAGEPWVTHEDPFLRFAHFPTTTLTATAIVKAQPDAHSRLKDLLSLSMVNYGLEKTIFPIPIIERLLQISESGPLGVNELLNKASCTSPAGVRALMWLWKFDIIRIAI